MAITPVYTDIHPKKALNRVKGNVMPFRWSLNPYRGCTHGCSFCYARATHTYFDLPADDTFQRQIMVKSDAADVLEQQILDMLRKYGGHHRALVESMGPVAIGTATDPYQPVEARRQITRSCLEVLHRYSIPVTITTRSPLVLRDIDLLREMDVRAVHLSLHTMETTIWRQFEPATPSPIKRLEAATQLVAADIPVTVFIAPVLPLLTDSVKALQELCRAIKLAGVTDIMTSVLRLSPDVKTWFMGVLQTHHPHLVSAYMHLYAKDYAPTGYRSMLRARVDHLLTQHGLKSYHYPGSGATDRLEQQPTIIGPKVMSAFANSASARQIMLSI